MNAELQHDRGDGRGEEVVQESRQGNEKAEHGSIFPGSGVFQERMSRTASMLRATAASNSPAISA